MTSVHHPAAHSLTYDLCPSPSSTLTNIWPLSITQQHTHYDLCPSTNSTLTNIWPLSIIQQHTWPLSIIQQTSAIDCSLLEVNNSLQRCPGSISQAWKAASLHDQLLTAVLTTVLVSEFPWSVGLMRQIVVWWVLSVWVVVSILLCHVWVFSPQ
jgi:hypothetical protein